MEFHYIPPQNGIHKSLFAFGCECAKLGLPSEMAISLTLQGLNQRPPRRQVENDEIEAAVRDAYQQVLHGNAEETRTPKYPSFDRNTARAISQAKRLTTKDLRATSPVLPLTSPNEVLAELYAPDELVCVGYSARHSVTQPAAVWIADPSLKRAQFIVPHVMTERTGITKSGRPNRPRTVRNTGARRWVVCDFDDPPPDWQPSLIIHLAEFAETLPTLVLHSGNKSLHAWFPINGASREAVRMFEDQAAYLGADTALFGDERRCQLVRIPNGIRDNGRCQVLVYWNPSTVSHPWRGGNQ